MPGFCKCPFPSSRDAAQAETRLRGRIGFVRHAAVGVDLRRRDGEGEGRRGERLAVDLLRSLDLSGDVINAKEPFIVSCGIVLTL